MGPLTTDGTLCAVKAACTVWSEGKPGDNIKRLPIAIRHRHPAVYRAVDVVHRGTGIGGDLNAHRYQRAG